ncbi:radical SAM protein [Streptomyces monticola]|uniref:Radical SAM protein n=1 Tax=Streptomyces monticola TaxID=2666263 RepID=A0ABW2JMV8_9ACTN
MRPLLNSTVRNATSPHTVRSALISTAGHCKIACGFCFRADRARGFLDIPTYTRALSRLKEVGVEGICLTGGEPAHHPELRQLARLAHQFGLSASLVTSARDETDVERLAEIGHLLTNVTVSADTLGAMDLGGTQRSVLSGIATLEEHQSPARTLHLTYWKVTDDESRFIYNLVKHAGVDVQLSPVTLDEATRRRMGLSLDTYTKQQRHDTECLGRYFHLTARFRKHLQALQVMHRHPSRRRRCCSSNVYVSARGEVRHCPYSKTGVQVYASRADIRRFLTSPPQDWTTPDCAAICRADAPPVSGR